MSSVIPVAEKLSVHSGNNRHWWTHTEGGVCPWPILQTLTGGWMALDPRWHVLNLYDNFIHLVLWQHLLSPASLILHKGGLQRALKQSHWHCWTHRGKGMMVTKGHSIYIFFNARMCSPKPAPSNHNITPHSVPQGISSGEMCFPAENSALVARQEIINRILHWRQWDSGKRRHSSQWLMLKGQDLLFHLESLLRL
jgi:hypothetical protein